MIFRILHRVRYHTVFLHDRDAPRSPAARGCPAHRNTRELAAQMKHRQGVRGAWRVCQCALSALYVCAPRTQTLTKLSLQHF